MIAAFEILIANNAVRSLVREGKTHQIRNVLAVGPRRGHVHARDLAQPPRGERAHHLRGRGRAFVAPEGDRSAQGCRRNLVRARPTADGGSLVRRRLIDRKRVRGEQGSTLVELLAASRDHGYRGGRDRSPVRPRPSRPRDVNRQATTAGIVTRDYAEALDVAVSQPARGAAASYSTYGSYYTPPTGYSVTRDASVRARQPRLRSSRPSRSRPPRRAVRTRRSETVVREP